MPKRVCVVTNGTLPIPRFDNIYFYWISLDGTESVHDNIRGKGSYKKTKDNIIKEVLQRVRNHEPHKGMTIEQHYSEDYKEISGGK